MKGIIAVESSITCTYTKQSQEWQALQEGVMCVLLTPGGKPTNYMLITCQQCCKRKNKGYAQQNQHIYAP